MSHPELPNLMLTRRQVLGAPLAYAAEKLILNPLKALVNRADAMPTDPTDPTPRPLQIPPEDRQSSDNEIIAGLPEVEDPILVRPIDRAHPVNQAYIDAIDPAMLVPLSANPDIVRNPNPPIYGTEKRVHTLMEPQLVAMINDMWALGMRPYIRSAYRTIADQIGLVHGVENSDAYEAPWCSQHHSGLAVDLSTPENGHMIDINDGYTTSAVWKFLQTSNWRYGFVTPYTDGHDGIAFEPWHQLYVGIPLSTHFHQLQENGWNGNIFTLQNLYQVRNARNAAGIQQPK